MSLIIVVKSIETLEPLVSTESTFFASIGVRNELLDTRLKLEGSFSESHAEFLVTECSCSCSCSPASWSFTNFFFYEFAV
jgi:hypothetical protein